MDTLKKDWDPKLTLRDVLIVRNPGIASRIEIILICTQTISCLLIQPNPDSALNATAGHLLQDDYDSFFRQAWLMTSIHASIPLDLREAALTAKTRGEESDNMIPEDTQQRPALKCKAAGSSSVLVKKLPQRITSTQPSLLPLSTNQREEESASDEDETSGSKENDPILSPDPVPAQMPRRPMLTKRPLSDLPIPTDAESENIDAPYVSPFDQNVVNNKALTQAIAPVESSRKSPPTAERIQSIHSTGRGLQDTDANSLTVSPFMEPAYNDISRPTKRIRSEESKENIAEGLSLEMSSETSVLTASGQLKAVITAPRKDAASAAPGTSGMKGKSRAGLRRL